MVFGVCSLCSQCQAPSNGRAGSQGSRRFLLPEFKHGFKYQGQGDQKMKKIYVGNLSYSTSEDTLREMFSEHGEVVSAALVMDRETGRPRGFGFVEMANDTEANAAIEAINGTNIDGRDLTVNEARPRQNRGGGGGGGGYGGGGGRSGGGGGGGYGGNRGGW